ncbi:hypothetical protein [Portibacter marinus]|uniref:hypothetical protein n=1 Tax=Portibacter marinus TaxID=2898660 RepID=UPI001F3CBC57|nr:hypothetical protein [Portibacter marinus]
MTKIEISDVTINEEPFFKISHVDKMRPFFMSIVSESNHWMFISSNGGLTAGRKNAEYALFPYYTDDKITESSEITGSRTILRLHTETDDILWEPFSIRQDGLFHISRNLYKNKLGNKVIFEEVNHDLDLTFSYQWSSSDQFGFIKSSKITNERKGKCVISMIDGIQNILPYGVGSFLQSQSSNLVDAYKRNQIESKSKLGIFALSAIIVDKAEPSEALKANIAWTTGLDQGEILLSSIQLDAFRKGQEITEEKDIKAEKGAYFLHHKLTLNIGETKKWYVIADVNKNHSQVIKLIEVINQSDDLISVIMDDIEEGSRKLIELAASADALQLTSDHYRDARHFSNVLFNIMRGGIFDHNYRVEKWDLLKYLQIANPSVPDKNEQFLNELPDEIDYSELIGKVKGQKDSDLQRLLIEYLPLKFSRRHGDPSRPWNKFSINTKNEIDGSKVLDYQGNWRDIFQNWEALAMAFPNFLAGMIFKFLNASTFEGYNPYRVTKDGFDWETIEPDDPWSYIGYWGDHQVIYLLKLLELSNDFHKDSLHDFLDNDLFVYANVPYKIKSFEEIIKNPQDTIDFDHQLDEEIRNRKSIDGADSALLKNQSGNIHKVNFFEKTLALLLSKLSNFIPEGGIWMNTQRPEWNDANNALVGNGISMVTLYYLKRYIDFFLNFLKNKDKSFHVSEELSSFFIEIFKLLKENQEHIDQGFTDADRRTIVERLGLAAQDYRNTVYKSSFSGEKVSISTREFLAFLELTNAYVVQSIKANERPDGLFHAYNILDIKSDSELGIDHLSEMLEGQVAILSSGYLKAKDVLNLLDALKQSKLYREDQNSYILYPNKNLPSFLEKNTFEREEIKASDVLWSMVERGDAEIIEKDVNNRYHFNGNFKNAKDLKVALDARGDEISETEARQILDIFEKHFNHKAFTGRSGTFYGYEGLGSIYWHMVSKLHLAVQECYFQAVDENTDAAIIKGIRNHYYSIGDGIGIHKSPEVYGAFPTDPYSHTPATKGAQQPGMTGQVKEDILVRYFELGIKIEEGCLMFDPQLLKKTEFLDQNSSVKYVDVRGNSQHLELQDGELFFSYCQVPVIYSIGKEKEVILEFANGTKDKNSTYLLSEEQSQLVFNRTHEILKIRVKIPEQMLK